MFKFKKGDILIHKTSGEKVIILTVTVNNGKKGGKCDGYWVSLNFNNTFHWGKDDVEICFNKKSNSKKTLKKLIT